MRVYGVSLHKKGKVCQSTIDTMRIFVDLFRSTFTGRKLYETDLPAIKTHAQAAIRLSCTDENESRASDSQPPSAAGPQAPATKGRGDPLRTPHRSLSTAEAENTQPETPGSRSRPASLRLNRHSEFQEVRKNGRSLRGKFMRMSVFATGTSLSAKCGFITSKKVGGAVVRNRLRRLFREIHRLNQHLFPPGLWIVVIAHREAAAGTFEELQREWLHLAGKLSILRSS